MITAMPSNSNTEPRKWPTSKTTPASGAAIRCPPSDRSAEVIPSAYAAVRHLLSRLNEKSSATVTGKDKASNHTGEPEKPTRMGWTTSKTKKHPQQDEETPRLAGVEKGPHV